MKGKNRSFWRQVLGTAAFAMWATATPVSAEEDRQVGQPAAGEVAILRGLLNLQYPSIVQPPSMPPAESGPVGTQISASAIPARERN